MTRSRPHHIGAHRSRQLRSPILAAFCLVLVSCVSPSSGYRNVGRGQHEVALVSGAGLAFYNWGANPMLAPQLSYRYGLTDHSNLVAQLHPVSFPTPIGVGAGAVVGYSHALIRQGVYAPELDLSFEFGTSLNSTRHGDYGGIYAIVPSSSVGLAASYRWPSATTAFLGAHGSVAVAALSAVLGSIRRPLVPAYRGETFAGLEQELGGVVALSIECRLGLMTPLLYDEYVGDQAMISYALYPGLRFRF